MNEFLIKCQIKNDVHVCFNISMKNKIDGYNINIESERKRLRFAANSFFRSFIHFVNQFTLSK